MPTYGNCARRDGGASQINSARGREAGTGGGFGLFYDLATQEIGDAITVNAPPFGASKPIFGGTFPLAPADAQPPPISSNPPLSFIVGSDPALKLPYTLQWNLSLEQALGPNQTLSASYVGATGRRLLQEEEPVNANQNIGRALLLQNRATSDYHGLQLQFQRRLSRGFQALASYTWSHSIDTASSATFGSQQALSGSSDLFVRALGVNANRGPSDFDIRHSFSTALTYDIPTPPLNTLGRAFLGGWSLESVISARSAPPANVYDSNLTQLFGEVAAVRPDLVPGIPLYLFGSQYPGGKAINNTPGAVVGGCSDGSQSIGPFCPPPTNTGTPTRQGNLGRNALRGFGAAQWDFAVHRNFAIHELLKLQFRAEMFNVLNHPNFGSPAGDINNALFGQSTQMLGQSLGQGGGGGGLTPLYQMGGARSVQLALKLQF